MKLFLSLTFFISWLFPGDKEFLEGTTGTMENLEEQIKMGPKNIDQMLASEEHTQHTIKNCRDLSVTINNPVIIQTVYITHQKTILDAQIMSQTDDLSEDFRMFYADAAKIPADFPGAAAGVEIEFYLTATDPSGFPTNAITQMHNAFSVFYNKEKYLRIKTQGVKHYRRVLEGLRFFLGKSGGIFYLINIWIFFHPSLNRFLISI